MHGSWERNYSLIPRQHISYLTTDCIGPAAQQWASNQITEMLAVILLRVAAGPGTTPPTRLRQLLLRHRSDTTVVSSTTIIRHPSTAHCFVLDCDIIDFWHPPPAPPHPDFAPMWEISTVYRLDCLHWVIIAQIRIKTLVISWKISAKMTLSCIECDMAPYLTTPCQVQYQKLRLELDKNMHIFNLVNV